MLLSSFPFDHCPGHPLAIRDPCTQLQLFLLLSLLYVSRTLFCPVLDCVVFPLATLTPVCNGQKCLESSSGIGNPSMVFCFTLLIGKTQPGTLEGKRGLDNVILRDKGREAEVQNKSEKGGECIWREIQKITVFNTYFFYLH